MCTAPAAIQRYATGMFGGVLIALLVVIGGLGLAVRRLSADEETNTEAARRAGAFGVEVPAARVVQLPEPDRDR